MGTKMNKRTLILVAVVLLVAVGAWHGRDVRVFEVARGGILREGLGYERNDVAVVLNVQPDHLGTPRVVIDPLRNVAVWSWGLASEAFGETIKDLHAELYLLRADTNFQLPSTGVVLERGYSITRDASGGVLRDARDARQGERISTTLARGALESQVLRKTDL